MLTIYENTVNLIFLTLTEKKRNSTKNYLFDFTNDTSGEIFYCIADDKSHTPYRYNSFCITHQTSDADQTLGQVDFTLPGFYTYNVYENPDSVLIPDDLNKVETGKMKFITESQAVQVLKILFRQTT